MTSWKTTLGGTLTAAGAALMGASMMDWIRADHKYWFMLAGFVLSVLGPIAHGIFARDNDKSSEDVGAKPKPMLGNITVSAIALAAGIALAGAGCSSTAQRTAFRATGATVITVDKAMTAWNNYVGVYHPPAAVELEVKGAFEKYQAAMLMLIDANQLYVTLAGSGSTNAPAVQADIAAASAQAATAFADLLYLLRSFGVHL